MKAKRKLPIIAFAVGFIGVFCLSGCVEPVNVETREWDHINEEGTAARIWGALALSESIENWKEGFVWDTEAHENWEDYPNKVWADNYDAINRFSANIEGLGRFTEYHYRAYVEDSVGGDTTGVGEDLTFIPGGPRAYTHFASNVDPTSAHLNGELGHMGGAATVDVLFEYGEDWASLDIEAGEQTLTALGDFSTTLTDLESCKEYYFRAVATNDADTHNGWKFLFVPGNPTVATQSASDIGADTATLEGRLWDLAGMPSADVWFKYGDDSPDNLNQSTSPQTMDATGEFSAGIGGLNPGTTYWVRAFVDNDLCQNEGIIITFTTQP